MPEQGERPERREEEIVPRGHAREVVGHAPHQAERRHEPGEGRRQESQGDAVERRHECEREAEQHPTDRGEPNAEELEARRIEIAQAAGVDLVEVPVRNLTGEDALGTVGERALVVRDPASFEKARKIEGAAQEHEQQHGKRLVVPAGHASCPSPTRASAPRPQREDHLRHDVEGVVKALLMIDLEVSGEQPAEIGAAADVVAAVVA